MIEIEKKFFLTKQQRADLLQDAQESGRALVEDEYYDTSAYDLTANDLWLRNRNGSYELKAPLRGGNDITAATNRYQELTDPQEIAETLRIDYSGDLAASLSLAGIARFMKVYTDRTSYQKEGFRIDIDAATYEGSSFTHAIAEIELLVRSEAEADQAEQRILEFAHRHHLSTDKVVLGKVLAYLQSERPDHYQTLVDAGIV